jgi:hypothetical protein
MASSSKKRTTMAKLNRESKLREKRQDKLMRKEARKRAALEPAEPISEATDFEEPADEADAPSPTDA